MGRRGGRAAKAVAGLALVVAAGCTGQLTGGGAGDDDGDGGGGGGGDRADGGGDGGGDPDGGGDRGDGGGDPDGGGALTDWPDADNTGVPPGAGLTPSAGLVVTTDGAVLDGLDVDGAIVVRADDVTIRDTRVTHDGPAIRFEQGTGLVVERVTLVGEGVRGLDGAIYATAGTIAVRRVQVSGFGEGVTLLAGGGRIEDSYFHAMANADGELMDGIETWGTDHVVIRHNVIEMPGGNSVIKLPLDVPAAGGDDFLIEGNLLAGGGWALYGGHDPGNANPSFTNVRVVDNHFSTRFEPGCGYYGPAAFVDGDGASGNVWHETGAPLEL